MPAFPLSKVLLLQDIFIGASADLIEAMPHLLFLKSVARWINAMQLRAGRLPYGPGVGSISSLQGVGQPAILAHRPQRRHQGAHRRRISLVAEKVALHVIDDFQDKGNIPQPSSCASKPPPFHPPQPLQHVRKSQDWKGMVPPASGSCRWFPPVGFGLEPDPLPTPSYDNIRRQSSIGRTTPGIPITSPLQHFSLLPGTAAPTPHGCSKNRLYPTPCAHTRQAVSPLTRRCPFRQYPPAFPLFVYLTRRKSVQYYRPQIHSVQPVLILEDLSPMTTPSASMDSDASAAMFSTPLWEIPAWSLSPSTHLTDAKTLAYLLKYDSVHGTLEPRSRPRMTN